MKNDKESLEVMAREFIQWNLKKGKNPLPVFLTNNFETYKKVKRYVIDKGYYTNKFQVTIEGRYFALENPVLHKRVEL